MVRFLTGLACMGMLAACASASPDATSATLQESVYVVGDRSAPVQQLETSLENADEDDNASVLRRLNWFFSGR